MIVLAPETLSRPDLSAQFRDEVELPVWVIFWFWPWMMFRR